jgi:ornithine--oxo-acid transaminase
MVDEIQTGLGRTGTMFAHEHDPGAAPDVLILGKALGGGVYPVSAVLARQAVMAVFAPGDHGSTFGGNPLAAAVGLAALDVLVAEDLPQRARRLGARLSAGISALASPRLAALRGRGLLLGLEIRPEAGTARELALELLAQGVLAKDTHRQVLRLAPPLVIDEQGVDWLLARLAAVL